MRTRGEEYWLADLLEEPALGLAIERGGFDRGSLERVLRVESRVERRRPAAWDAPPAFTYIAE
jgi:hypothetical protein